MVALVVTECVLQYSLALSNLLQRPWIDLVEAASEAETVISSLRKIRQDDNVWQELYQEITKLAEKQNALPRTAGRQQHRDNVPADTPEEYWRRSVYYPLLDHIANELETRLVVPKDRFLAQYLIPSKLASLTPERELQVFMPFAGDLPDNNFAAYKTEMVRWKCNGKMLLRSRAHLLTHSCMLNPSCILTSTEL